jgi:hypothetical protein
MHDQTSTGTALSRRPQGAQTPIFDASVRPAGAGVDAACPPTEPTTPLSRCLAARIARLLPSPSLRGRPVENALALVEAWSRGTLPGRPSVAPATVRTGHLARGPGLPSQSAIATWLDVLPRLEMQAALRLWPEVDSRHARLAAARLLGAPRRDTRLPPCLRTSRLAMLLPADGCHAPATEMDGILEIHIDGAF